MEKILEIKEQISELINFYNKLKCVKIKKGVYKIFGELNFKVSFPEIIRGKYEIEIIVTKRFPKEIPIVKEIGGAIPSNFHKNDNEILCLGIESEIKIFLQHTPNLLKFVNSFVIPYFYSFKKWQDTGKTPFGERSHSIEGIIEFYKEYLLINNIYYILNVLRYTFNKKDLDVYCRCPCGSGKNIKECYHEKQLKELSQINIKDDYLRIVMYYKAKLKKKGKNLLYPLTNEEFRKMYNIKSPIS